MRSACGHAAIMMNTGEPEVEPGQIVVVDVEGVDPEAAPGSRAADDKARFTFRGEPKRLTGPGRPAGPAGVNALPEGPGPGPMGAENLSRGAQRPSFLAILLDLGVLVVQMHGRAGPVGHHPGCGTSPGWTVAGHAAPGGRRPGPGRAPASRLSRMTLSRAGGVLATNPCLPVASPAGR